MTVHVLGTEGCRTMGDALRDLDARALIRSHFILMCGDTITNAKLLSVLEKHKYVLCIMSRKNGIDETPPSFPGKTANSIRVSR